MYKNLEGFIKILKIYFAFTKPSRFRKTSVIHHRYRQQKLFTF
jgi:hypothetical protein